MVAERSRGRRDSSEGVSVKVGAGVHEMSLRSQNRERGLGRVFGDKVRVIDCR